MDTHSFSLNKPRVSFLKEHEYELARRQPSSFRKRRSVSLHWDAQIGLTNTKSIAGEKDRDSEVSYICLHGFYSFVTFNESVYSY